MSSRRRRSLERATLSDVARSAGCSLMSASRALSQPERVSDALRERVIAAVKALGYVPHTAARNLASARSNLVAVVSKPQVRATLVPIFGLSRGRLEGSKALPSFFGEKKKCLPTLR